MKLIFIMMISVFTLSAHADTRLPTYAESKSIISLLDSNNSIRPLIDEIKSKRLSPFYEVHGDIISRKGRSALFHTLIDRRFDLGSKNKGDLKENLELLELIIQMGLNINIEQPINMIDKEDKTPLHLLSRNCSIELFNLFTKHGADPSLDNTLWSHANALSRNKNLDTTTKAKCAFVAEYLLSNANGLSARTIYANYAEWDGEIDFSGGEILRPNTSINMIKIFKDRFSVNFSTEPSSEIPSDEWYEEFLKHFKRPSMNYSYENRTEEFARNWWEAQPLELKKWACYYSTFDEAITMLINGAGEDPKWLASSSGSIMQTDASRAYGEFAIETFVPYCQALK